MMYIQLTVRNKFVIMTIIMIDLIYRFACYRAGVSFHLLCNLKVDAIIWPNGPLIYLSSFLFMAVRTCIM
jgi:hypothetical protein